ncbi:unnamed protein product, partial [Rotaria sordida]
MEYSSIQLNHLPDEILIYIFKKLSNAEIVYSLSGVNKRLNKIVHDSIFTNDFSLFMSTSDGLVYSLSYLILYRFCSHILPKIHQKIQWLHFESVSMEGILRAINYPNLNRINLHNIRSKIAIDLFNDKQIIYWSDYFPKEKKGYCRIYSYPYTLKYYHDITNHFSGGVFKYVRKVSLFDERPFQHEFFLRIEKSFPLMEELT